MRKMIRIGVAVVAMAVAAPAFAETATAPTNPNVSAPTGVQIAARKAGYRKGVRRAGGKTTVVREYKQPARWVYMAKRMRPPKSEKWKGRWNELGHDGWELVSVMENMYIFKRPADFGWTPPPAPEPTAAPAPKKMKKAKK